MKLEHVRQTRMNTPLNEGLAAQVDVYEVERGDLSWDWFIEYGVQQLVMAIEHDLDVALQYAVLVARQSLPQMIDDDLARCLAGDDLARRRFEKVLSEAGRETQPLTGATHGEGVFRRKYDERLGEAAALRLTHVVSGDMLFRLALHAMMTKVHEALEGDDIRAASMDLHVRLHDDLEAVLSELVDPGMLWKLAEGGEVAFSDAAAQSIEFGTGH